MLLFLEDAFLQLIGSRFCSEGAKLCAVYREFGYVFLILSNLRIRNNSLFIFLSIISDSLIFISLLLTRYRSILHQYLQYLILLGNKISGTCHRNAIGFLELVFGFAITYCWRCDAAHALCLFILLRAALKLMEGIPKYGYYWPPQYLSWLLPSCCSDGYASEPDSQRSEPPQRSDLLAATDLWNW